MTQSTHRKIRLPLGMLLVAVGLTIVFGLDRSGSAAIPGQLNAALCFVLCGMAFALDSGKDRAALSFLGAAVSAFAVANAASSPETSIAFFVAGLVILFKNRPGKTGAILALQLLWLILFVIAFGSFFGHALNAVLDITLFEHMLGRYGMGRAASVGLLMLSMMLGYSLRLSPSIIAFYEGRQDRQVAAQGIVLILGLSLVSGLGGAGILAREIMSGFQGTLSDALQANARHFRESVMSAAGEADKIAELSDLQGDAGTLQARLQKILELQKAEGVRAIWVSDGKGRMVASVGERSKRFENRIKVAFRQSAWLFWREGLHLESDAPVYRKGREIGEIGVETDLRDLDSEFDLAQSLGQSGEVVVCAPGNGMMGCFPSRLHQAVIRFPTRIKGHILPMSHALSGKSGVATGMDYRGKLVVAAYRPVSDLGLGMVEKIDADELYVSARSRLLPAYAFLLGVSSLAAWLLYRRTRPLVRGLISAEAHARTILDNIPEGVVTTDGKGVIRSLNLSARKIFGPGYVECGKEFPLLKGLSDCVSGNYPRNANCIEGGCPGIEGDARRQDGSAFPYEMAVGKFDFEGEKHFICVVRDLTERKQAEMMLREKERYTRHLLENLQTAVVVHASDGSVSYLNAAARRFFGFGTVLTGMHIPNLFVRFSKEDGSTMPVEELPENRVLADGQPFYNYVVGVEFQGEAQPRWALVNGFPDFDENGSIREVIVSFVDITDRKIAEEALRGTGAKLDKLNRLYLVLSRVNEATVHTRSQEELFRDICRIVVESGGFVMAWIGLLDEASEIIPVMHAGHDAGYIDLLKETGLMAHDGPAALTIREGRFQICQDIANDPRMVTWKEEAMRRGYRSSAGFAFELGGKRIGLINIYADRVDFFGEDIANLLHKLCADISFALDYLDQQSKRQAAEEMLRQVNSELEERVQMRTRQLEAANAELAAFSYSVSHDLRAPLRSIDGFSEILLKRHSEQLDDTALDYLARVRRAARRMGELIEDLLQLASVTRSEIRKEAVDLSRIVESVIREFDAGERHVEWAIQPDIEVLADARLMRIVMENLIGNAWKFTSARSEAKIEFGVFEQGGEKILYVRDNGAGFDMKYAGKLFGAFQRLHKVEEFEGTGIGLATVQRIIRRHDGRIWAEGEVDVGATFYFTL